MTPPSTPQSETPRTVEFEERMDNDKYVYRRFKNGGQDALRYGEPWRELTGDNLTYFMGRRIEQLERDLTASLKTIEGELREKKQHSKLLLDIVFSIPHRLDEPIEEIVKRVIAILTQPIPPEVMEAVKNLFNDYMYCSDEGITKVITESLQVLLTHIKKGQQ